jgi:hypothetical protein
VVLSSAFEFRAKLTTMLRSHYRIMPAPRQALAAVAARDHRAGAIVVDLNCRSLTFPMQFGDVESGRAALPVLGIVTKPTRDLVTQAIQGGVCDIILSQTLDPEALRERLRLMIIEAVCAGAIP